MAKSRTHNNQIEVSERALNVSSDLKYLRDEWDNQIDDHSLRRSSGLLRRLLVEGELGKSWRELGFNIEPSILSTNLENIIGNIALSKIVFAQAGGATYGGLTIYGVAHYNVALEPREAKELSSLPSDLSTYKLSEYLDSPCIIIGGNKIIRRSLIKYIANKLGGVHPLSMIRNLANNLDRQYRLLDSVGSVYKVADKKTLYFELLSIGQSLISSPDIITFIKRVDNLTNSNHKI